MKKIIAKPQPILSPQTIQMIATYNEDGSVDLMNAAWGGQIDNDLLILSLDKSHRTVSNLLREKAFTIGLPAAKDIVDCDFVGIVSGNVDPAKFEKTDLHAEPSAKIHAPVIAEFPITFECTLEEVIENETMGFCVLARVEDILFNEDVLDEKGRPDIEKMNLCFFSPIDHSYRAYGDVIAKAFSCGLAKKGK